MSKYDVSRFRNVTVALNTPFTKSGEVDLPPPEGLPATILTKALRALCMRKHRRGFSAGQRERMAVVEAVKEEAGEEMAVIVHVGCPDTRHAAELARHAQKAGADATSAVPCVYYHLGEESVYRHWTAITEAATCPFSFITYRS